MFLETPTIKGHTCERMDGIQFCFPCMRMAAQKEPDSWSCAILKYIIISWPDINHWVDESSIYNKSSSASSSSAWCLNKDNELT